MNKSSILICLLFLAGSMHCIGQKNELGSLFNGTYHSPTNAFKNDNYLRLYFLNDTTFVFTVVIAYDPKEDGLINQKNHHLILNGHSFFGVGRLINNGGVRTWIGVSDFLNAYACPDDPGYLNKNNRASDFQELLNLMNDTSNPNHFRESGLAYNIYKFDFFGNDEVKMKGIQGVTRFFEEGDYKRRDTTKMIFGLEKDDGFFKKMYTPEWQAKTAAVVNVKTDLKVVPIDESFMGGDYKAKLIVDKGEFVCLTPYNFMRYTFVVQYDKIGEVVKSGWVLAERLGRKY